jgi:hypothetical protein
MAKSVKKSGVVSSTVAKPRKSPARKKTASTKVIMMSVAHEQIAQLAHHYWLEGGCQHGRDAEDWLRAEQELLGKAS